MVDRYVGNEKDGLTKIGATHRYKIGDGPPDLVVWKI